MGASRGSERKATPLTSGQARTQPVGGSEGATDLVYPADRILIVRNLEKDELIDAPLERDTLWQVSQRSRMAQKGFLEIERFHFLHFFLTERTTVNVMNDHLCQGIIGRGYVRPATHPIFAKGDCRFVKIKVLCRLDPESKLPLGEAREEKRMRQFVDRANRAAGVNAVKV